MIRIDSPTLEWSYRASKPSQGMPDCYRGRDVCIVRLPSPVCFVEPGFLMVGCDRWEGIIIRCYGPLCPVVGIWRIGGTSRGRHHSWWPDGVWCGHADDQMLVKIFYSSATRLKGNLPEQSLIASVKSLNDHIAVLEVIYSQPNW